MRRSVLARLGTAAGVTAAAAVLSLSGASAASAQSRQNAAPAGQTDCYYSSFEHIWYCY